MPDMLKIIKERRTIRKFQNKPVSDELLNTVLEAGRWAQSWANTQCWEVIVVKDQAIKEALQKTVPEGNPSYKAIVDAPIVLCLCAKKGLTGYYKGKVCTSFGDWLLFDIGIFAQNIALTAHSLGLGTVIVGLLNHDEARKIISLPNDYDLVVLMPLGFPAEEPYPPPRKELKSFVHYNKF
ncbi:MAG: nitroreductase family protein [Candidatus Hydrogenedentes bacterium]|nr:nitroreductase family protein [Candidatus Hydrogenedentota bacterium]